MNKLQKVEVQVILLVGSARAPKANAALKLATVVSVPVSVELFNLTIPMTSTRMFQEGLAAVAAVIQSRTAAEILRSTIMKIFTHTLQKPLAAMAVDTAVF